MAESTESPKDDELIRSGETKVDAVSRLLQESMGATLPDDGSNAEALRQPAADDAPDDDADDLGEIRMDDLGMKPADDGGDTTKSFSALQDLAEKSGIPIEDVYKLEVGFGDGRPSATLGELKDNFATKSEMEEQRGAFETHRTSFENEMIRARGELSEVLALLPELPAELVNQGKERYWSKIDTERQALFAIRPEWADDSKFQAAREFMLEHVAEYSFSKSEFENVHDHRLIKLIFDHATLKKRSLEANASKKKLVREHRSPRSTSRTPPRDNKQSTQESRDALNATGSVEDKVRAVNELISGNQTP